MNENDKIEFNKIIIRAAIDDKTMPYLKDKSFGFDFAYMGDLQPQFKEKLLKQLDARWEQMKAQIIFELFGE